MGVHKLNIAFDPAKDAWNRKVHGVSLERAAEMDLASALVIEDDREDYGEHRYLAFGRIGRAMHCLVFTVREDVVRVISLRRATTKELLRHAQRQDP